MRSGRLQSWLGLALAVAASATIATESDFDRIWSYATLHQSDSGAIRSFSLSGRLQPEAIFFDTDEGDYHDFNWRRFRFGFKSELAHDWLLHLEADYDLNEESGTGYNKLTDAYLAWQPGDTRDLRMMKHSAGFTLDGATSSKKLLLLQRSNLTNNLWFTAEYFTGVSMKGDPQNPWNYWVGVFSNDGNAEFSKFDASYFTLTSAGYNWAQALGMENATVHLDYVYNKRDENNNTPDLSNVISLSSQWEDGNWGLWTDLCAGRGYFEQSDLFGLSLMPFYNINERWQLVARYTYIESEEENGIRFEHYARKVTEGLGDRYNEFHLGLNLFFYRHKLKWQSGIQYTHMADRADDGGQHNGWGIGTGLRISW